MDTNTHRPRLTIGDFSRLSHLSVKALRHYHAIGLLEPAEVDRWTGYRSYDPDQATAAHLVRRLRDLDVPLEQVHAIVHADSAADRDAVLAAHLARMEAQLDRTRRAVGSLRALLAGSVEPDLVVEVRDEPAVRALVRRADVEHEAIGAWCDDVFGRMFERLGRLQLAPAGPTGGVFSSDFFHDHVGEVSLYVPLPASAEPAEVDGVGGDDLHVETVPPARVAVARHHGPYEDLDRTYGALGRWVAEAGVGAPGPIRERYVASTGDSDDPAAFVTEVCWPLAASVTPTR